MMLTEIVISILKSPVQKMVVTLMAPHADTTLRVLKKYVKEIRK